MFSLVCGAELTFIGLYCFSLVCGAEVTFTGLYCFSLVCGAELTFIGLLAADLQVTELQSLASHYLLF